MSIFLLILPWAALGVALAIVAAGAVAGKNVFKKQGVAWVLTIVMACAAIGIGYARSPMAGTPGPRPDVPNAPGGASSFVRDEADVLSAETVRELDRRNQRLWERYSVSIGVVTTGSAQRDLYQYAMKASEEMGLGGYDMIVVMDIGGDNYWLLQGNDISRDLTNEDCTDYAYEYLEYDFARGMYGDAALELTQALERWYETYFD